MNIRDILKKSVYDQYIVQQADISVEILLITLAIASAMCLFAVIIYRFTFKGALYNSSFAVSLLLTGIVTSLIILPISHNLTLSLGMVGALSIVRYRTAVKDPKDIAYMFWVIAIGLTCGAGFFLIAIAGTAFIAIIMVIASQLQLRYPAGEPCIAVLRLTRDANVADIKKAFRKIDVKALVIHGDHLEMTAELDMLPSEETMTFLNNRPDVVQSSFVKYNGDYAV